MLAQLRGPLTALAALAKRRAKAVVGWLAHVQTAWRRSSASTLPCAVSANALCCDLSV